MGSVLNRDQGLKMDLEFFLPVNRWKRLKVAGVFSASASIWSAKMLFMSFKDAGELFEMPGVATDLLVYADPENIDVVDKMWCLRAAL